MKTRHNINNERFSIRICTVAKIYGFKTIGSMHKALKKASPHAKWGYEGSHIRGTFLLREIEEYLEIKSL